MSNKLIYVKQVIDLVVAECNEANQLKLWSLIQKLAASEIGNRSAGKDLSAVISEIHELCYEQNIRIQGVNLYACFPHKPIAAALTEDYIEMEHCRRRDDFDRFCLAMYQQLENMVNFLVKHYDLWSRLKEDRVLPAFTSTSGKLKGQRYGWPLERLIKYIPQTRTEEAPELLRQFFQKRQEQLDFREKLCLVLYYIYFNAQVKDYDSWSEVYKVSSDLYSIRNKVHRGEVQRPEVALLHKKIDENRYRYYLTFTGFLAEFIDKVCLHYQAVNAEGTLVPS